MPQTFSVLIVDDDEDDQLLIGMAFEQDSSRYRLHFASDGTDVLERIKNPLFLPDLILLDLNMPLIGGFEILQHLKGSPTYRHIPVIVLATSNNQKDIDRAYELRVNSFVTKPINHQELINLAGQIRAFWFQSARIPAMRTSYPNLSNLLE